MLVMKELLDPYSARNPWEWIYVNFMMTLLMSMPGLGIAYLLRTLDNTDIIVLAAMLAGHPAYIVFRLIRRIVICKRFAKTGKPPVWG